MKHIAIFGAPRSGTSWLGQIFNSSSHVAYRFQPLFSYALKGRLTLDSSREEIAAFYEELLDTSDEFVLQKKNITGNSGLNFQKKEITHLVWKEVRYQHIIPNLIEKSDTQVIGIVRHPCAVINSWLQAPKEFDKSWNPMEEWRWALKKNMDKPEEFNGYEKWKQVAFMFINLAEKYPDRFFPVTYEKLHESTVEITKEMFQFLSIPFEAQTHEFINESTTKASDDPYGVFRSNHKSDDWRGLLDERIMNEILSDPDFVVLNRYYKWRR